MRFAFFRPNNVGEGILTSIASRLVWEKNVKVAVWGSPVLIPLIHCAIEAIGEHCFECLGNFFTHFF